MEFNNTLLQTHFLKRSERDGFYKIDKELAEYLLTKNIKNYRALDSARVRKYAEDIKAGLWKANGETIVFDKEGHLVNGQHRLNAIIKSNATVIIYIVFDVDDTELYDSGKTRGIKSDLNQRGYKFSSLHIGTGKMLLEYGSDNENWGNGSIIEFILKNSDLICKAVKIVSTSACAGKSAGKKAACAAIAYSLLKNREMSETELYSFFKVVNTLNITGSVKNATPALVLRKQLEEVRGGGRAVQKAHMELTYKALRDYKFDHQRIQRYNYDTDDGLRLIQSVYQ